MPRGSFLFHNRCNTAHPKTHGAHGRWGCAHVAICMHVCLFVASQQAPPKSAAQATAYPPNTVAQPSILLQVCSTQRKHATIHLNKKPMCYCYRTYKTPAASELSSSFPPASHPCNPKRPGIRPACHVRPQATANSIKPIVCPTDVPNQQPRPPATPLLNSRLLPPLREQGS